MARAITTIEREIEKCKGEYNFNISEANKYASWGNANPGTPLYSNYINCKAKAGNLEMHILRLQSELKDAYREEQQRATYQEQQRRKKQEQRLQALEAKPTETTTQSVLKSFGKINSSGFYKSMTQEDFNKMIGYGQNYNEKKECEQKQECTTEEQEEANKKQYELLKEKKSTCSTERKFWHLYGQFKKMNGYKDTIELAEECKKNYDLIKEKQEERGFSVGRNIIFGGYEWRVINIEDDEALLLSEKVLESRAFDMNYKSTTWEGSELRKYLYNNFYNNFSENEKNKIIQTNIENPDNLWYGTKGGNETNDKIFLLSIEGATKNFFDFNDYNNKNRKDNYNEKNIEGHLISNSNNSSRIAYNMNGEISDWWLRTPGNCSDTYAFVTNDGSIMVAGTHTSNNAGVRPAIFLHISADVILVPIKKEKRNEIFDW